jgi:outer membrane protein assembly factor BamB
MNLMRWAAAGLLLAGAASAQDWPGWRGAGRDGKLAGFQAPDAWPKELKREWQVEVGEGHATPALVGGRLYLHVRQGDDEVALCLDAATGREIWRDRLEVKYEPPDSAKPYGKGPYASPLVADGRVFTFGIRSTLSCLEAATGKVLWRNDFKGKFPKVEAEWGSAASPIVVDGKVLVSVGGGPGPFRDGKGKGAVLALDAATGDLRWSWDGDCAGSSSPVLATIGGQPQVITQTESLAVGLSPADGKLLWKQDFRTAYNQNSITPVVFGNQVILSGYGMGTKAYKVDGGKVELAWETSDVSMYMSSPVLKGERLYGFSEKASGQFFCLDAKSGESLWTGDSRQGTNAAVLDGGNVLLALLTPGPKENKPSHLVVFEATDKDYVEKARIKVADTPAFAHPVVAGKSIYVKDRTKLTLWTIP